MARLLDAKTGQTIGEGSPLEVIYLAAELGGKAVVVGEGEQLPSDADFMYDDVGLKFDPEAVLKGHREALDGLVRAHRDAKGEEADGLARAIESHREQEQEGRSKAREATAIREAAHARLPR